MDVLIRSAEEVDLPQTLHLFEATIDAVCADDYTVEQRRVWKSSASNVTIWLDKMKADDFIVAQLHDEIVGFASLKCSGYVDLMYTGKQYLRKGIGTALLRRLEERALHLGCSTLKSDVSVTAKSFFQKNGFIVISRQATAVETVEIVNFKMQKDLNQQQP